MRRWLLVTILLAVPASTFAQSKSIGPTFGQELSAVGLSGLPFAWGDDGTFQFDPRMTASQIAAVQQVYASHDPTKQLPNAQGFIAWIKATFDYPTQNTLRQAYPNVYDYITASDWAGVQWCLTDAKAKGILTITQYALFQGANITYHVGMVLP